MLSVRPKKHESMNLFCVWGDKSKLGRKERKKKHLPATLSWTCEKRAEEIDVASDNLLADGREITGKKIVYKVGRCAPR